MKHSKRTLFAGLSCLLACLSSATVYADQNRFNTHRPPPALTNFTDQLIVKLRDTPNSVIGIDTTDNKLRSLSAMVGVTLKKQRNLSGNARVVKLPRHMRLSEAQTIADQLRMDPAVEYAEPDRILQAKLVPNDARYRYEQWNLKAPTTLASDRGGVNLPAAWDITRGSPTLVIAVIDTGLVPHLDIDTNILDTTGRAVRGYDFVSSLVISKDGNGRDNNPTDPGDWVTSTESNTYGGAFEGCDVSSSWHGTHVAGTIGALTNNSRGIAGINWSSRILPVRVLGKCGYGQLSDIIDGMRWAAGLPVAGVAANPYPAKVINLSLGGSGACGTAMQNSINEIVARGKVIVVAAGNESEDVAYSSAVAGSGHTPANCNNVIAVAATTRNGAGAFYTNYGTLVDIAAPGGDPYSYAILSTLNRGTSTAYPATASYDYYANYVGTSMAAPHVTGIASLMLSIKPTLTPAQVLSLIRATARPFPANPYCSSTRCGPGIIDAARAVAAARR